MKYFKIIFETSLFAGVGLLLGAIFFRQIVGSNFDLLLGDVGDARLNGVILEHWWQVLNGSAKWLSPGFFYPAQGVLGYSDAGFLNALPYVFLRFIGIGSFTSYQIVLFVLVTIGWGGTILFFRWILKLSIFPTIAGAALFVFPNSMAIVASMHTQFFAVYFLPYLAIGIALFLQNFKKPSIIGILAGIFVAILIPAIFYTSYYVGWFFVFYTLLLLGVGYGWCLTHRCGKAVWRNIVYQKASWQKILPYCIVSAICFVPFLLTYIPVLQQFGNRKYRGIACQLPSLFDYLNVGADNWLYGKILNGNFAGMNSRPMAHELSKGLPVWTMLVFLLISTYYIWKTVNWQYKESQDSSSIMILNGIELNDVGKISIVVASLSLSVLFAWLLMLNIQGISLWWLVLKLVPGAGGIRAVYRFAHVLAFPISISIAIGLHQLLSYTTNYIHSDGKRNALLTFLSIIFLLLLVEQFNTGSLAKYSKQKQQNMMDGVPQPPQQARVFALLPTKGSNKLPYEAQVDAMLIAQKYGLQTINGYSGQFPHGWDSILHYNKPEYTVSLNGWIKRHALEDKNLYFFDTTNGVWLPYRSNLIRSDL